jgi:hypothetical protein
MVSDAAMHAAMPRPKQPAAHPPPDIYPWTTPERKYENLFLPPTHTSFHRPCKKLILFIQFSAAFLPKIARIN